MDNKIKKQIYILIDPGKHNSTGIDEYIKHINTSNPDLILIGGSQNHTELHSYIKTLKQSCKIPVYLFPGNISQFSPHADGILLISLLSGRNPEYLINQHVQASIEIASSGINVIPTGYILIDGGIDSAVAKASNTNPIKSNDINTIVRTALAGELLGFKMIYLEAGSGAKQPIGEEIIKAVRSKIKIPLIVGGGLTSIETIDTTLNAGADIIVVGNYFEKNIHEMQSFVNFVHK